MTSPIREHDFGGGDLSFVAELSIAPFGVVSIASEDNTADSRNVLSELIDSWDELWPHMLERLKEDMEGYGVEQTLGVDDFIGSVSRTDKDAYMGDRADLFLRLEFEEPPLWDFFLRGKEILHFQPVF